MVLCMLWFKIYQFDLSLTVELNSKKCLPRPTFRSFINFKSITTYRGTYARKCN